MSYPVPRPLFEAIQSSLYAASRNFIRSLAEDVLEVPAADLMRRVLPSKEAFNIVLYETEDIKECYACAVHPHNHAMAVRCRRPVIPGDTFCAAHKYDRPAIQQTIDSTTWHPLKVGTDLPPLWYDEETGRVVNGDVIECGYYNYESGQLTLFNMDED